MGKIRGVWIGLLALLLSGCIEVETVVKVNADGSGTVEERVLMGAALLGLAAGMGESGSLLDQEALRRQAATMGSGVTLQSAEAISDGPRQGYRARYTFSDINQLRVNQNPGDKTPFPSEEEEVTPEEYITFRFTPGNPAELLILSEEPTFGDDAAEGLPGDPAEESDESEGGMEGMDDPDSLAMMQELFKEMRFSLVIEVAGDVVESNASHRDGSRITMMELDFGKLMGDFEKFQKLSTANPQTIAEVQAMMEGVEGLKMQLEPELRVRFTPR